MSATILVVDDVDTAREAMAKSLRKDSYEVLEASTLAEARTALEQNQADICVLDIKLPDGNGLQLMDDVAHESWQPKFIVITAYGEIDIAVDAMQKRRGGFPHQAPQHEDPQAVHQTRGRDRHHAPRTEPPAQRTDYFFRNGQVPTNESTL